MLKAEMIHALVCPICEGNLKQKNNIIFCKSCHTIYHIRQGIPVIKKNSEELAREVQNRLREKPNWYSDDQIKYFDEGPYRHHLMKRVLFLNKVIELSNFDRPKILDAGCGDGINLRNLIKVKGSLVFGIDYNVIRLMKAKINTQGKSFLVLGSLLEKCFKENYFDIILLNHVLEHIECDLEVLLNLYRILKSNGILILGVPNEGAFLWQLHYRVIQPHIMRNTDHVHFYTVKKLKKLLNMTRFKIIEIKYMGWGVPHIDLDAKLRQYKCIDDLFEIIGKLVCKSQATSLYFILRK